MTQNAQQSEKPTAEPTEEPAFTYNEYECNELRKYLDLPINGTGTVGGYLNPDYVSEDPATWNNYEEGRKGRFIRIEWTDDGHISTLSLGKITDDKENKATLNWFTIEGFEQLRSFSIYNAELQDVTLMNCPNLEECVFYDAKLTGVTLKKCPNLAKFDFSGCSIREFDISSEHFPSKLSFGDGTYGPYPIEWLCTDGTNLFFLHLETVFTKEGSSIIDYSPSDPEVHDEFITCEAYTDGDEYYIYLTAIPPEGYKFDGWYTNNNVVSTDEKYRIPCNENGSIVGVFYFAARFVKE